ncbi:15512_t:CDS:2, partial [Racocetra persica]
MYLEYKVTDMNIPDAHSLNDMRSSSNELAGNNDQNRRQKHVQNEKNCRKKITDGFNMLRELIPFGLLDALQMKKQHDEINRLGQICKYQNEELKMNNLDNDMDLQLPKSLEKFALRKV